MRSTVFMRGRFVLNALVEVKLNVVPANQLKNLEPPLTKLLTNSEKPNDIKAADLPTDQVANKEPGDAK